MKKDLLLVLLIAALAGAVFFLTGDRGGAAGVPVHRTASPYRPDATDKVLIGYKVESDTSQIPLFEVAIRAPGDCTVRYQIRGRPLVERAYPLSDGQFHDILDRLARVDFFDVEEVPRSKTFADVSTVTVALTIREQQSSVRIDARRRASRDLGPVLEFFDGLRKAATPEPVATGD